MDKRVQNLLLAIIYFGSILVLFLPLLVLRTTVYPFVFPKAIFFQVIVEIIFAIWLGLAIYEPKFRPNWKNPLLIGLAVFVGVLILSGIFGLDIQRSFYSTQERMTGIITWLHLLAWFIVLLSISKEKRIKSLIWITLFVSLLIGLYGIGQHFGLPFLIKEGGGRMSSTLGNPIFLGAYAMGHFFLGLFLFLRERRKIRFLSLILALFNLAVVFFAASRGVMIGVIGGIVFFVGVFVFTLEKKRLKYALSILFIFLVVGAIFATIYIQGKTFENAPSIFRTGLYRFAHLKHAYKDRLIAWQIGISGFKDRPILGWGWANYNLIFNKYYNPYFLKKGIYATWFDHSHNQLLDILSLGGILGFLSYLSIFLIILLLWKKNLRYCKRKEKLAISALIALNISYFVQNLFVFDTPAPLIVFILNLSILSFYTREQKEVLKEKRQVSFPIPLFIFLVFVILGFSLWHFNFLPFKKSKQGALAVHFSKTDFSQSIYWFQQSLDSSSFTNPEIRCLLARAVSKNKPPKTSEDIYRLGLNLAVSELEKSTKEHPLDCRYWLYLGQLYNLSSPWDKEKVDLAEKALNKALALSPSRQQIYYELSHTALLKGEYEKALDWSRQAVVLEGEIGMSWWNLGISYLASGQEKRAIKAIDKALWGLGYYQPGADIFLAQAYEKVGNYEKAVYFCDKLFYYSPEDIESQISCVFLAKKGEKTKKMNYYLSKIEEKDKSLAKQIKERLEEYVSQNNKKD